MQAEGGTAASAFGVAIARAWTEGGPNGVLISHALAVAIAIYTCPGIKPIISSAILHPLWSQYTSLLTISPVALMSCKCYTKGNKA